MRVHILRPSEIYDHLRETSASGLSALGAIPIGSFHTGVLLGRLGWCGSTLVLAA
jgi:hypothetical protein